jgi:hypothetical protein
MRERGVVKLTSQAEARARERGSKMSWEFRRDTIYTLPELAD